MELRLALEADIPAMQLVRGAVRENVLRDPTRVTTEDYRAMLRERGRGWVAEVAGHIVGFAVADLSSSNVWALFVEPGHEGLGIGRRLHDVLLDWMFAQGVPSVWLTTDPGTRAERFYRRARWRQVAVQPNGELRFEITRGS